MADPQQGSIGRGTQAEPHGKPRRCWDVGSVRGKDFMHCASRQSAHEGSIDRAGAQTEGAVLPGPDGRVETGESLPQRTQSVCSVHDSMFLFCSIRTQNRT